MCSVQSLTKTKATVSFGLALQPVPRVPKSCRHRWELLRTASFQNSESLRHFPFVNQKQGTQKSAGFLLSNRNHTKVWTDLNCLINSHLICLLGTRGERRCSRRRTASVPAIRQPPPRNAGSFAPDKQEQHQPLDLFLSATLPVLVLVITLSLFKCRF